MSSQESLSMAKLNAAALEEFIYTPVSEDMIGYLADAARDVIRCDEKMMPPPQQSPINPRGQPITPPRTPPPVEAGEKYLPSLEKFIRNLVNSSNVQVPTLMSTLVYLNRLKSRLQPEAKGLRCTAHRIFLAALILTAKYLNDSSPKNKHWAKYTQIWNAPRCVRNCQRSSQCDPSHYRAPDFEFSRTEVNLMEKQLLMLLEWDLRVTEDDLYREFAIFLAPIREQIAAKYERRQATAVRLLYQQQEQQLEQLLASTQQAYSPSSSPSHRSTSSRSPSQHRDASRGRAPVVAELRPDSAQRHNRSSSAVPSLASSSRSISSRGSSSTGASTPPDMSDSYGHYRNGSYSSAGAYAYPGLHELPGMEMQHQGKQYQQQSQYYQQQMPQVPRMAAKQNSRALLPYEIEMMPVGVVEAAGGKRNKSGGFFRRMISSGSK